MVETDWKGIVHLLIMNCAPDEADLVANDVVVVLENATQCLSKELNQENINLMAIKVQEPALKEKKDFITCTLRSGGLDEQK